LDEKEMKIKDLLESATAGATSSGSIASVPSSGGGNLLGGPKFKRPNPFRKSSKKKTENIIKRVSP
jgi:hypothetical protein